MTPEEIVNRVLRDGLTDKEIQKLAHKEFPHTDSLAHMERRFIKSDFRKFLTQKIKETIDVTRASSKNGLLFKKMEKEDRLPFKNKQFDVAMLNDCLHHTKRQFQLIRESQRVADTVLIFETRPTLVAKMLDHLLNFQHGPMAIPLTHREPKEWMQVLKSCGAKFEFTEATGPFYYPVSHFAFRLSEAKK